MTESLRIDLELPFAWQPAPPDPAASAALWQEALLLLRVIHSLDSPPVREADRDAARNPGWDRLEAKLDLVLHLLARDPRVNPADLPIRALSLHARGLRCPGEAGWRAEEPGVCLLRLNPALPLPIRLPARLAGPDGGAWGLRWDDMPENLAEAWSQWLFRQHRRAIHARREGA